MPSDQSPRRRINAPNEPEQTVQETDALLQETVERLSRRCPPHLVGEAARDDLQDLKPRLQEALASLEDIEGHRSLTEEELSRRRAFKMLLVASHLSEVPS